MCLKYDLGSGSGREAEDLGWKQNRSKKPLLPHHWIQDLTGFKLFGLINYLLT